MKTSFRNDAAVNAAKATTPGKVCRIGDGQNLYLTISANGAKSWLFIWFDKTANKQREMGLGSFTGDGRAVVVNLKRARERAEDNRVMLRQGRNPLEEKIAAKIGPVTFEDMLKLTIQLRTPNWKVKNGVVTQAKDWTAKIDNHAAKLKSMLAGHVTVDAVVAVLAPIWLTKTVAADRVRNIIEQVMDTAIAKGHHKGINPATLATIESHLGVQPNDEGDKQPSLHHAKLPAAIAALMAHGRMGSLLAVFTTLTGTRRDEARLMRRGEVDEATRLWTVPSERMKVKTKNDRGGAHVVPLSDAAWTLYKSIVPVVGNPFVFAGRGAEPVSASMPNDMIVKGGDASGVLGLKGEATLHGMRATFSTWANENRFNGDAIELCLAHVVGNGKSKTQRSYNRAELIEERTALLQAWGNYATGVGGANVADLAAARAARVQQTEQVAA